MVIPVEIEYNIAVTVVFVSLRSVILYREMVGKKVSDCLRKDCKN